MKKSKEKRCLHCKRLITIPNYKAPLCPRCVGRGAKKVGAVGTAVAGTAGVFLGGVKLAKDMIKGKK